MMQDALAQPGRFHLYHALERELKPRGDFTPLLSLLNNWAQRTASDELAAECMVRAAKLLAGASDRRAEAMTYVARALQRDPHRFDVIDVACQIASEEPRLAEAVTEVQRNNIRRLHSAGRPSEVAAAHWRLGQFLQDTLGAADEAIDCYELALEQQPDHLGAIYGLRTLLVDRGENERAAALLDREAEAESDLVRKAALLGEAGQFAATHLGELDRGIRLAERARRILPNDPSIVRLLAHLMAMRAEREDNAGDAEAAEQTREMSSSLLYDIALSLPPHAALAYTEDALNIVPDHEQAMQLLERMAEQTGRLDLLPLRWVRYLDANAGGPGADERRRKLGRAYLKARQPKDAMRCLEPLLERGDPEASQLLVEIYRMDGQHEKAIRASENALAGLTAEDRVRRLHDVLDLELAGDEPARVLKRAEEILQHAPTDQRALQIVGQQYRRDNDYEKLRDHLVRASKVSGVKKKHRKRILSDLAALYANELKDVQAGVQTWQAVCNVDPHDLTAKWKLAVLLEKSSSWDELCELFEEILAATNAEDEKVHVLRRLHEIHSTHRNSDSDALRALRRLYEIAPHDREARDLFCQTLLSTGAFLEAVPLLRAQARDASTEDLRVERLRILEDLLRGPLADPESALEVAQELAEIDPDQNAALARVVELASRVQHWGAAIAALQTQAEKLGPNQAREQAQVLVRMGRILDERMGHTDRSRASYEKALCVDPTHKEALGLLTDAHARLSMHAELVTTLAELKERSDVATRPMYLRTLAETLEFAMRDSRSAAIYWEELIEADPSATDAIEHLERAAEESGDIAKQTHWLSKFVEQTPETERKVDLLLKLARIYESQGKLDDAIETLRDIADGFHHDHPDGLRSLDRLLRESERHEERAPVLRRMIRSPYHSAERAELSEALVALYEKHLDEPQNHRRALELWAQTCPNLAEPFVDLARLLVREEEYQEAIEMRLRAEKLLPQTQTDDYRSGTLQLAKEHLDDPRKTLEIAAPLLEREDEDAHAFLVSLATNPEFAAEACEVYERLATHSPSPERRADHWLRAGHAAKIAGRIERALSAYSQAVYEGQSDREVVLEAFETTIDENPSEAVFRHAERLYEHMISAAPSDLERVALHERAATVFASHAHAEIAARHLLRACRIDPSAERLSNAVQLAYKSGQLAEATELLNFVVRQSASLPPPLPNQSDSDESRQDDRLLRMLAIEKLATPLGAEQALRNHIKDLLANPRARPKRLTNIVARWLDVPERDEVLIKAVADTLSTFSATAEDATAWEVAGLAYQALGNREQAKTALMRAIELGQAAPGALERLEQLAESKEDWDRLQRVYAAWLADSFDATTSELLMRARARILDKELGEHGDAANVYQKLIPLVQRSGNNELLRDIDLRLIECLRETKRFTELIGHISRVVGRTETNEQKVAHLADIARTWQRDLKNPWEAREAWGRVLRADPANEEAKGALDTLKNTKSVETGTLLLEDGITEDEVPNPEQEDEPRTFEEYAPLVEEDTQRKS